MSNSIKQKMGLENLPNEISYTIFSSLPTSSLLPISSTSRHIHDIIHRIIYRRMLSAARITDRKLSLECFHPAAEKDKSPIEFIYNGTCQKSVSNDLRDLYSHFLPIRLATTSADIPISGESHGGEGDYIPASRDLVLQSYESFSQLCVFTKLLNPGPHKWLFRSCAILGENIIRLWRDWFAEQSKENASKILWVNTAEDIGLKVRVLEKNSVQNVPEDDISYTLVFDELVIRSSKLLLQIEESIKQEEKHVGKFCGLDGEYIEQFFGFEESITAQALGQLWMPAFESFARGVYGLT